MNRQNKFANRISIKYEGNLKTLTAVVSKYIENLLQTLVKNFTYYRVPFCHPPQRPRVLRNSDA